MERSLLMSDKKKDKNIKKQKTITKNTLKPDDSLKKSSLESSFQINAEIVNGTCPHCNEKTVLVSLWTNYIYRCMTCGGDLKQRINGKISYIPHVRDPKKFRYDMKMNTPNG
jgi:ribosomal protein S27E